ncbi:hypothetical protein AB0I77_39190 [Streptomyces sp. NPDC050619]|uniref:hypothetical protein n=1 Tax=Streptomyces sp. NPDC050619 TaxID=3157214 RepID=UPI003431CC49
MSRRRRVRIAAAAGCLAGVLALTACSGDGDSGSDSGSGSGSDSSSSSGSKDGSSAGPSASASAETGGGTGDADGSGGSGGSDGLAGSWLATTGGKAVALVITGTEAGLFATGGTVCTGTAGKESGTETIALKCTDGSEDRATGTVDSVDKTTLKVTWKDGLGAETYTRSEGGTLPSGLPTASLGS